MARWVGVIAFPHTGQRIFRARGARGRRQQGLGDWRWGGWRGWRGWRRGRWTCRIGHRRRRYPIREWSQWEPESGRGYHRGGRGCDVDLGREFGRLRRAQRAVPGIGRLREQRRAVER